MSRLSKPTAILSLLTTAALVSASSSYDIGLSRRQDDCNAVHLFLARGNNEPYPGRQQAMVEAVCDGVSNCGYEDLIYSALYTDLSCQTAYDAVHAAYAQVSEYACRCPDAKLVLTGYSQGGNIYTDFLGGGGGMLFNECIQPETPALDRKTFPGNRIDAVVVFGDTRHTADQPYNRGGGSGIDGIFPRPEKQLEALKDWTDILYAYCGANDPICAADQNKKNYNVTQHLDYYDTLAGEAAAWIKKVAKIENDDSDFVTQLPTSISGTAQDYATIASDYVPGGTVAEVSISTAKCSTTSKASSAKTTASVITSTSADEESTPATTTALSSTTEDSTTSSTSEESTSAAAAETTASDDGAATLGSVGLVGSFFLAAAALL